MAAAILKKYDFEAACSIVAIFKKIDLICLVADDPVVKSMMIIIIAI
jgi:hypothetical protein